jgi:class 3 adenylate cyclase
MTGLQTSVLMKTDMSGSTARVRGLPESDLNVLFTEHHALVARIATTKGGVIVKSEGDGFWLVFPSVTAASLAALAMQDELRLAQPGKGDDTPSAALLPQRIFTRNYGDQGLGHRRRHRRDRLGYRFGE